MNRTSKSREKYNRLARFYDSYNKLAERLWFSKWREKFFAPLKGKILEVGIGTGENIGYYNKNAEVIGIDFSEKMLEKAREKLIKSGKKNITLKQMDAENLNFKDNAFDPLSRDIINLIKQTPSKFDECIDRLAFSEALECVWILISFANAYIEQEAPWALEKKGETEKLSCVLFNLYEALRIVAALVSPFMPGSSLEIWKQLNFPQEPQSISLNPFGMKIAGIVIKKGQPLFPRLNK